MMQLIDEVHRQDSVATILTNPDVVERVALFRQQSEQFAAQLRRVGSVHGDVVVLDLREEETIHTGNRLLVYALFPQCRVSAHIMWGKQRLNTVVAVGKSILDRTSRVDIGRLMLAYGGGGHANAGTCQVPHADAARVVEEIVAGLQTPVLVG